MILVSPFLYFYKGGLFGSYIYLYIPVVLYIQISNKGLYQKGLLMLACFTLLMAVIIEYYHPEIVVHTKNKKLQFFEVLINIFFDVFLIGLIIFFSQKSCLRKRIRTQNNIEQYKKNKDFKKNRRNKDIYLLSLREREVYQLIVEGNSNKEIANALYVSTGTVKNHITSIYRKLEVNNRVEFFNKMDS